ncbi:Kelch repeat-containing protein [Phytophthora cinnamomi]|uniref:Kelch repeat-containing protein n=1 Tax=Phytophthora cinnamomi TaxID=4785 RepID=UPI00355AA87E|nr:Kelch repeat-containing protein [Phytophthora cinnamomi]
MTSGDWKWEKMEVAGTPPSMRYWYSLTVLHGMAILYGGYGHPQRLSDTFALRFDLEIPTWQMLKPHGDAPGQSSTHSVCVIKDRMYIFGGYDGKYRRGQLFAFEIDSISEDVISCAWRKVETLGCAPAPRYTHSSASIGSQLIVYGGNTGCLKGDAYVLDLGNGDDVPTWKLVKSDPPLIPRAWHRAVVYNDAMYVFGGRTSEGNDNQVTRAALCAAGNTAAPSGASGSGSAFVEVSPVGDGSRRFSHHDHAAASSDVAEIHFSTRSEAGSADSAVDVGVASGDGSQDKLEVMAYPLVTEPLLVLSETQASAVRSSGSTAQEEAVDITVSQVVLGSSSYDLPRSSEPPEEMHGVPSNPTLVNAVAFDGRAAVSWKAPDDDGLDVITAYEVGWFDEEENVLVGTQRVTSASVNFVTLAGPNASASTAAVESVPTSTVVEPLVNGRSYSFKVRAHNVNGFSVWSAKSLAATARASPITTTKTPSIIGKGGLWLLT